MDILSFIQQGTQMFQMIACFPLDSMKLFQILHCLGCSRRYWTWYNLSLYPIVVINLLRCRSDYHLWNVPRYQSQRIWRKGTYESIDNRRDFGTQILIITETNHYSIEQLTKWSLNLLHIKWRSTKLHYSNNSQNYIKYSNLSWPKHALIYLYY